MAADWEALWGPHTGGWAKFMAYAWIVLGVLMIMSSFLPGREWWALLGAGWLSIGLFSFWRAYHPPPRSWSASNSSRSWWQLTWVGFVATTLGPIAVLNGIKAWFWDGEEIFGSAQLLFAGLCVLAGWKWGRISTRIDSAGIRHVDTLSRQNSFVITWSEVSDIGLNTSATWATHVVVESGAGEKRPLQLIPAEEVENVRSFWPDGRSQVGADR